MRIFGKEIESGLGESRTLLTYTLFRFLPFFFAGMLCWAGDIWGFLPTTMQAGLFFIYGGTAVQWLTYASIRRELKQKGFEGLRLGDIAHLAKFRTVSFSKIPSDDELQLTPEFSLRENATRAERRKRLEWVLQLLENKA